MDTGVAQCCVGKVKEGVACIAVRQVQGKAISGEKGFNASQSDPGAGQKFINGLSGLEFQNFSQVVDGHQVLSGTFHFLDLDEFCIFAVGKGSDHRKDRYDNNDLNEGKGVRSL